MDFLEKSWFCCTFLFPPGVPSRAGVLGTSKQALQSGAPVERSSGSTALAYTLWRLGWLRLALASAFKLFLRISVGFGLRLGFSWIWLLAFIYKNFGWIWA